jgi:hypothetical protein
MKLKPDESGSFGGKLELDVGGKWEVRGRARMLSGGLDKRTSPASFSVVAPKLVLADGSGAIDLGEVKAGAKTATYAIDFEGSVLPRPHHAELSSNLPKMKLTGTDAVLGPDKTLVEVAFDVMADHPGGPVDGQVSIKLNGTEQRLDVPVTGTVVPLTFWEKWGRLVIVIGAGVAGLFLLIFIVLGFTKPHRFPPDSRIHWGDSIERLNKNELVISEMKGTGTGFYRSARLRVGGAGHELAVGGVHVATIWMESASRIMIRGENVELRKVNKFDDKKTKAVEDNECSLETGEIFQAGELYLRIV